MNRRSFLGMGLAASSLQVTTSLSGADKPTGAASQKFLLVHGAWHGGWCWKRVARLLNQRGHEVRTPTLTGLGERKHLMSASIGLDTHIDDVLGVLAYEDLRDVVLVGHSYGGMVITGVAEKNPQRIAQLVYLDAFVPEDGKAQVDYQGPETLKRFQERARAEGEGYKLPPLPAEVFGITKEADLEWVRPRLDPHPLKTKLDAIHLSSAEAAQIPRAYIYCNNPAIGPFTQFADRVRTNRSWRYAELATGHDAMITEPEKLTDLLLVLSGTNQR